MVRVLPVLCFATAGAMAASPSACLPEPTLGTSTRLHTTSDRFASWTIDTTRNRLFFNVNFSDPRLVYLTSQIGGGPLRLGGSGSDVLMFATEDGGATCGPLVSYEECLNTTTLNSVLELSAAARAPLIVGLNIQPTNTSTGPPGGPWNASNARALLTYVRDNAPLPVLGFELGNECNGRAFTPQDQAAAFAILAGVIEEVFPPSSQRPGLYGPDADGAGPIYRNSSLEHLCTYLTGFVQASNGLLDAVTYHEYIETNATTVLDPSYLDASLVNAQAVVAAVRSANATVPVWVGESALHTGDSPPNSLIANCSNNELCGRFGSSLWYADTLGAKAAAGVSLFLRQDLVGASYALVNTSTPDGSLFGDFTPSPDYYLLWLWQRLIGTGVLSVSMPPSTPATLRTYAFCAKNTSSPAAALVFINLASTPVCVATPSFAPPESYVTQYSLTAGDDAGVQSWTVRLNDVLLQLQSNGSLPPLQGTPVLSSDGITVEPQSVSIAIVPAQQASLPACTSA